jgi:PAS domain S-box-containing protein
MLRLWVYVLAIGVMWTLVVGVSLVYNLRQQRQEMLEMARTTARTAYEKDVIYRRWNAQHGGVYVPITEETQPNPYLQEVSQRPIEVTALPASGSASDDALALTLVNPAYMTRQVHELAAEFQGVQGHITSLDPIRPANAPDGWEREALRGFEEGQDEASTIQVLDGVSHMRLMRPLITEEGCLQCHAEQGYEVGEVRGGISVSVPMRPLQAVAQQHERLTWLGHSLLWAVGLAIIGGGGYALQGNVKTLEESEERYRSLLQAIQAAVVVHDADGTIVTSNPAARQLLRLPDEQLVGRGTQDEEWRFLQEDGTAMPTENYPVNRVLATRESVRDLVVGIPDHEDKEGEADEAGVTWALVNADPVFAADTGEITQVIITFMDITDRKEMEEALQWQSAVEGAVADLSAAMLDSTSIEDISYRVLKHAKQLTGSPFGYVGHIDPETGSLVSSTLTREIWDECQVPDKTCVFEEFSGLWGWVLEHRKSLMTNEPQDDWRSSGIPEGHVPIKRFLSAPAVVDGQLVGQIALVNADSDYTGQDLALVERLASLYALALHHTRTEERLRFQSQLLDSVRESVVATDLDGRVVYWGKGAEDLYGYTADEVVGESIMFITEPDSVEEEEKRLEHVLETGFWHGQYRQKRKDGTWFWADTFISLVVDEEGQPSGLVGIDRDITERKRAARQIMEQKNVLENTLEALTHPFFVTNADDYKIEMANSASIPEGGLPPDVTCYALTHQSETPCHSKEHPCPLEKVKASKEPAKVDHIHYASDGSPRYVEVYGYPIFDEDGDVVQMIEYTLDVTERRRVQKALADKTAELARSNAELEEFAYIASHDLQEPLRKVQAFGDRLQGKYGHELEDRGRDYLARMQSAATRMRALINDLLTYSRVTTKAKSFEPVDLNTVMEHVIADLQVRIEETDGCVEVGHLPTVEVDRVQMRRVLQNLVGNALKFHQAGQPPVVKVYSELVETDEEPLSGGVPLYRIFVEDNGIGFDKSYVEQVFAPFQRLHGRERYEGTGMGLAICRKIVERHAGRITVESEPGQGAKFIVTLPRKQSEERT